MKATTVMVSDLERYGTWSPREVIRLKKIEEKEGGILNPQEIKEKLKEIRRHI